MAAHCLERLACPVVYQFVVAGSDPYPSLSLQPDLRRPQHVPGGMQADVNSVVFNRFAIIQCLKVYTPTETDAQQLDAVAMRQIMPVSPPCMVAVRMCDHSPIHRPPRINEKFALR